MSNNKTISLNLQDFSVTLWHRF